MFQFSVVDESPKVRPMLTDHDDNNTDNDDPKNQPTLTDHDNENDNDNFKKSIYVYQS